MSAGRKEKKVLAKVGELQENDLDASIDSILDALSGPQKWDAPAAKEAAHSKAKRPQNGAEE